ncbi:hypothetical protein AS026_30905 [Rhizobium altiplani]|uniref:DUF1365 domain-containing protein n=1 Tax=Rhizobium altiplani TaxID=1864509 RepID=A0A120FPZ5_9HYPH|nr:DUF1365 family protein [Rhizobium altiplani]KWV57712.1 hypothetical protein AS026_30905 [Rhizobium altiplani]
MTSGSALYVGEVIHARHRPCRHRLRYRVFSMLLDLDELPALDHRLRLFGHNRWGLYSFQEADHGEGMSGGLRAWVERQLIDAGVTVDGIRIRLLCYPRIFGYVFNPLTVYFCSGPDGAVRAVLYEVCNTFLERHTYVIPVATDFGAIRQSCAKELYVSPFVPMDCRYEFRIAPPDKRVVIAINECDDEGPLLVATFSGKRIEISDRRLLSMLFKYPLMTLKVMGGIHWEALRLWMKGVPAQRHRPAGIPVATTIVSHHPSEEPPNEPG